jgi:hypothetical protein
MTKIKSEFSLADSISEVFRRKLPKIPLNVTMEGDQTIVWLGSHCHAFAQCTKAIDFLIAIKRINGIA